MKKQVNSISKIMDLFLWVKVRDGFALVMAAVALAVILTVIFTAVELKKYRRDGDAEITSPDDGGMPDSDNTD